MENVRTVVTLGLEARQKAGIKVRQPLASITLKKLSIANSYFSLIQDELNIKEILENETQSEEVLLDTQITSELRSEGIVREVIRAVQEIRKQKGLQPEDTITLTISPALEEHIAPYVKEVQKTVQAEQVDFSQNDGEEIVIESETYNISLKQV
jgi:isoleucyl-tRNA synthetase